MRILTLFDYVNSDQIRTESTIIESLKRSYGKINSDYIIADYAWAQSINLGGLENTQALIKRFQASVSDPSKLIFVCQHISVEKLDWGNSIVFTPHATIINNFNPIAHYSMNIANNIPLATCRPFLVSFIGSRDTHKIRAHLIDILQSRDGCLAIDSGNWHFDKSNEKQNEYKQLYTDALEKSRFVLCPRGTGPSTIRLWEALASGCIPIIISDNLILPNSLHKKLPLLPLALINTLPNLLDKLISVNPRKLISLQSNLLEIYAECGSAGSLHTTIIDYIYNNS